MDSTHPVPDGDFQLVVARSRRTVRETDRMAASRAQAEDDSDPESGQPAKKRKKSNTTRPRQTLRSRNSFEVLDVDEASDNDPDFNSDDASGSKSEASASGDSDVEELAAVTNEELANLLPSKTAPLRAARKKTSTVPKPKKKTNRVERATEHTAVTEPTATPNAEVPAVSTASTPATSNTPEPSSSAVPAKKSAEKRNPIYHFFESVPNNADGKPGQDGDKHYRCYHGGRRILTITKAMRSSLNGLIGHLKTHFPVQYRLYEVLKARDGPPTTEELLFAANKKTMDASVAATYLESLEHASNNLVKAFEKQSNDAAQKAMGEWDQSIFEDLLVDWVVGNDQPFEEVERPEFKTMMEYTHRRTVPLHIPARDAVKRRVMKRGANSLNETKAMIAALESNVSLSLDAWTSSNGYAFLAIVMHYVSNDWTLEEILIDFRELIGAHSGENMADAVWKTLDIYGLKGKIQAITADNATNNDTMVAALESRCKDEGIRFTAQHARMRCMPHTVHLAALKLLEAIGAISPSTRAAAETAAYQDSVTAPVSREFDDDAVGQNDENEDLDNNAQGQVLNEVLTAVEKLRKIVRAVRSSPQRRKAWLHEVHLTAKTADALSDVALMLILDVKTRWSSTHQMLRRALDYRQAIDNFVAKNRELRSFELTADDWNALTIVTGWLRSFRDATTQMSATQHTTLSTTHSVFRSLQESLKENLTKLPNNAPPRLRNGLIAAHRKLSDYFNKFDDSPYYVWASLLDPRISYDGLKADYADDDELSDHVDSCKLSLEYHFRMHYAQPIENSVTVATADPSGASGSGSPQKFDFMARYKKRARTTTDEFEEYFRMGPEPFDRVDPVQWWGRRRAQFPNLSRLARDLFSIPGSAVAVERIFSGGRDTISLRRASLMPETIRTLMLVKQRIRSARSGR